MLNLIAVGQAIATPAEFDRTDVPTLKSSTLSASEYFSRGLRRVSFAQAHFTRRY